MSMQEYSRSARRTTTTLFYICVKNACLKTFLSLPSSLSLSLCRYSSEFTFVLSGVSQVVASTSVRVGIRHVDAVVDPVLGGRLFKVNGMSLYLEGGNWIATDQVCDGAVSLAFCSRSVSTCTQACAWLSLSLSLSFSIDLFNPFLQACALPFIT